MNILIATDGSDYAACALQFMLRFPFPRDSKMTVLTVVDTIPMTTSELEALDDAQEEELKTANRQLYEDAEALVTRDAGRLVEDGWNVDTQVRTGMAVDEILHAARETDADLIVLGSHGNGRTKRFLLGSVCDRVMEYAPCSVLIVKEKSCKPPQTDIEPGTNAPYRILVAYDNSSVAKDALALCSSFPFEAASRIRVVYVMPLITMYRQDVRAHINSIWLQKEQMMKQQLEQAVGDLQWNVPDVTTQLREANSVSDELLNAAEEDESDLIMVGLNEKSAVKRFLTGSISHRMARYGHSTVWTVRKKADGNA